MQNNFYEILAQCWSPFSRAPGWLASIVMVLLSLGLNSVQAAEQVNYKVLVLHGAWHEQPGVRSFDQLYSQSLIEAVGPKLEVSFKNLALDRQLSREEFEAYQQSISTLVELEGADLIVAVFPAAINFVHGLEASYALPTVLLGPSDSFDEQEWPDRNIHVARSSASASIENTVLAATLLTPGIGKIEVIADGGMIDQINLERTKVILESNFPDLQTHFMSGWSVAQIIDRVSRLSNDTAVLSLPFVNYQDNNGALATNFTSLITQASAVPVYGVSESEMPHHIAGGYITTAQNLASATTAATVMLMRETATSTESSVLEGTYVFNYEPARKWGLNFDLLNMPFVLNGQPDAFFGDHLGLVVAIAVLVLLLSLALFAQFISLKRVKKAQIESQIKEKQAREGEVRFDLLTGNSLDVIWTWDANARRLTYCSPAVEKLTGFTVEEFMASDLGGIMTDESATRSLEVSSSLDVDSSVFEIDLRCKDGTLIPCEIAARAIRDDTLNTNEWVGVTRDIRLRKSAEKEREQLENQVRQSQKFESLGTLAGGIAHDFNNMLGVVMGLTELLKLKVADSPDALDIVNKLMATSERAKGLVGQILTFSRQTGTNKEVVNLSSLAADTIQIMQSGIPKSIKVETNIAQEPVNVIGDSNELSQMLINTLTNAYEAIDDAGGALCITVEKIHFSSSKDCLHGRLEQGDYAKITIADTGVGLASERIEKIFDPFYTSKDVGNGMGLAIVRGIVVGHGGAIDLDSKPFSGTTFSYYLPLTNSEVDTEHKVTEKVKDMKRARILLVDDQKDLLEIVALMLGELGHDCIKCSNPNDAIRIISEKEPKIDLVITDYSMPEVSGLDVLKHCAKEQPGLPVIIASGYNESISALGDDANAAHHMLNKPFGFNELRDILQSVL